MIGFGGLNLPGDRYIDPRYRLANALMAGSVQRSPDTHWMQGLGRMSKMLAGAYVASLADKENQKDQDELYKILGSTEPKVQGPAQGPVSALPSAPQQPGGRWGRAMQNLLGGVNEYIQETPNQVASARNMLGQGINEINAAPEDQEPAGIGGGGSGTVLPDIKANAFAMPEFKRTRDDFLLEKLQMAVDMGNRAARPMLIQMQNRIAERDARREDMMAQMRFQMGMKEDDRAYQDLREDNIYRRNRKDALDDKAADREHSSVMKKMEIDARDPRTALQKNYAMAQEQGFDGTLFDYEKSLNQAKATILNPLEQKKLANLNREDRQLSTKARNSLGAFSRKMEVINTEANKAINLIENTKDDFIGATGVSNLMFGWLPESDANKLNKYLATIKANVGFGELESMRQNSPSGAALGSVTENENALLQAVQGSLSPDNREDLIDNLRRIQRLYMAVMREKQLAYESDFGEKYSGGVASTTKVPGKSKFKVIRKVD